MSQNGDKCNILDYKYLDVATQDLIKSAIDARTRSYSPYSKFPVGCSILCEDGSIYTGCNVENKSYGLTICAERTALVKAVSDGKIAFKAMAIIAYQEKTLTPPCGACRQFMIEFGPNIDVYITRPSMGQVLKTTSGELLPYQFVINSDFSFT